ncbi:ATP-binding protein [Paenibacillus yanchengensis]|uniref:histidine kinase n=1 Tax=Paenibacillus yanchengensis TaxID=2035833 RepID=A0ABW4YIN3_9BACL
MLYYFFALLTASIILLLNNFRSETNRWAAFFLCSASIGGLSDFLLNLEWMGWSQAVQFLNHTLTPYGVLIFSIVYSERFPRSRTRLYLKWLLLIPVVVMLVVTLFSSDLRIDFRFLLVWVAPYYLLSCYLLLFSLWKERDRRRRRNRFIATVIIVPTLLAVLVLINIGNVIAPGYDFFRYVSLFIVYSLIVALLCTFVYGVLGVKLRFERDPLESTMKVVSTGVTLLNHTIKNEIGKIAISTENLKHIAPDRTDESAQHLQIISNASDHMLAMVTRIHSQTQNIVLREQPCELEVLVDECLMQHQQLFDSQGISIKKTYFCKPIILGDAVHLKEVIGNLLKNAQEAMSQGGMIEVRLDTMKKGVYLSIQDSGKGIPADQLVFVVDPFYSTKHNAQNFGLGLSYAHNVMNKSGGSMEVASREGSGTLITLYFPRKKVFQWNRGE